MDKSGLRTYRETLTRLCVRIVIAASLSTPSLPALGAVSTQFQVSATHFEVFRNAKGWQPIFLKGVNMGSAKPGTFPGELAITKAEYSRWFVQIARMNANVIRVYSAKTPAFYEALDDYNRLHPRKPLYLIQGVWINEDDIGRLRDPYAENEKIKNDFIADTKALIDIIHGKAEIAPVPGHASGTYSRDVSQYVIAWILGIEWDPYFVKTTNEAHPDKLSYDGRFIHTDGASPFEVFLAEAADAAIGYETDQYATQRPLSFVNWPTTDKLSHPNEPLAGEDLVSVDMEHLKAKPEFVPGLFAAYHIYPYYPDFMSFQHEYRDFLDDKGKHDTYKAYLRDLRQHHTLPMLVAEFGVPSARGKAHNNAVTGFNQGNLSEQEQGRIDAAMLQDIHDEGYAGGVVFSWQDEWFKRTWNTMDLDLPEQRPFWSNPQTNEQQFGLLAFDPGIKDICRIDGSFGDWRGAQPVFQGNGVRLYAKSDEKYVYLMAQVPGFDFKRDTLVIPVDTIPEQGSTALADTGMNFARGAEFLITLHGKEDSRIRVEAYYDSFHFLNAVMTDRLPPDSSYEISNTGQFVPMRLTLSRQLFLPQDNETLALVSYETGKLRYGDGNPAHPAFNSLTDFAYRNQRFELRIPWQLLNVMDPSTKKVMGNLYGNNAIAAQNATGIYLGAAVAKPEGQSQLIGYGFFDWTAWPLPSYHERLKRSYSILRKTFGRFR
jgi:hypothetical protein